MARPGERGLLMFELLLVANAIRFVPGFHLFAIRGKIFAKTPVPKEHRVAPVFDVPCA